MPSRGREGGAGPSLAGVEWEREGGLEEGKEAPVAATSSTLQQGTLGLTAPESSGSRTFQLG